MGLISIFPHNWQPAISRFILGTRYTPVSTWSQIKGKEIIIDINETNLWDIAQNVPHLNVVISEGSKMFSNLQVIHKDRNGNVIENSPIVKLLKKPNPLSSGEDFFRTYFVHQAIYANEFLRKLSGIKGMDIPSIIWQLPPGEVTVKTTGKMFDQSDINGIVTGYELKGRREAYLTDDIIHIASGIKTNGVTGVSPIYSMQFPLSNIVAALKSHNIILTEKGLIGFISNSTKDSDGALPMKKDEQERLEAQFKGDRGLDSNRSHIAITNAAIEWHPMSFDVGQLKLLEGLEDSFGIICGRYGIDRDVFPSMKGATFENKRQGEIRTYQSTMQPMADSLMSRLAWEFNLTDRGETLEADYSWLPIMQSDKLKEAQTSKAMTDRNSILLQDGVISHEAYAEMEGVELTGSKEAMQRNQISFNNNQ